MLADFQRYGMIFKQSSLTLKGFSDEYRPLFETFLEYLRKQGLCDNSIVTWRGRLFRLEYFLLNRTLERFEQIEVPHINEYIESLAGFSNSTISSTLGCFRRLFTYAYENGYHAANLAGAIPTVRRFTPDDVAKILESSNREYPIGKRNFAVLMLAARTGLRVSDARELKFSAINWDAKTISIIQKKTHKPLELPLFEDVGWAILTHRQSHS
jgi:site-specific recombinase XerD